MAQNSTAQPSKAVPQEFPVNRVIPGWTEALQKMHVGDKWQLFVPAKLAYGMNPPGPPIEPGSTLVFEIELLDIVKQSDSPTGSAATICRAKFSLPLTLEIETPRRAARRGVFR